ncbi:TPA: hypothetical protein ACH3X1_015434 [Trebouxia sp. C0004]
MAAGSQTPQQAVVRSPQLEDKLTISLPLAGRIRNLDRPKSEALEKALGRLHSNAVPKADKKSKKRANQAAVPAQQDFFVGLYNGPTPDSELLTGNVSNEEAWQHGRLLVVGTQQYIIDLNPPIADKLLFAEEGLSQWQWYRSTSPGGPSAASTSQSADHGQEWRQPHTAAEFEGFSAIAGATARLYVPAKTDEGCILRVQCTPVSSSQAQGKRMGQPCFADTARVQQGPALTAAAQRHPLTPSPMAHPGVRVVTYNILADQYASREHAQKVLFGYCPKRYLDPDYRRPLILLELLGFHADIICLQEMDEKAFAECFLPQMQQAGFEGHYTNKASSTREGEATFYRTSRFRLAARQDVILRDCFKDLLHPAAQDSTVADATAQHAQRSKRAKRHAQFEPMLRSSPHLQRVLQGVATVAQMTLLEPVTQPYATPSPSSGQQMPMGTSDSSRAAAEESICVVNSHFFFHPRASHIRNIHTAAVMSEVEAFIDETLNGAASCNDSQQPTAATAAVTAATPSHRADEPSSAASEPGSSLRPAMLFCGDLNSDLNDGPPGTQGTISSHRPALLFCGDLNCGMNHGTPGVVQLLNSGHLPHDFWDWDFSAGFSWGPDADEAEAQPAETAADGVEPMAASQQLAEVEAAAGSGSSSQDSSAVNGISLSIPYQLRSADDLQSSFTNYVRGYSGLLDYIWYEPQRMRVERAIPLPSLEEVKAFVPSERFPSDHLSVVYDLTWHACEAEEQHNPQSCPDAVATTSHVAPPASAFMNTKLSSSEAKPQLSQSASNADTSAPSPSASEALTPTQTTYPIAALPHSSHRAVSALSEGMVIAVPTDTLYGLAADANSSTGIQRIYSIKHRQAYAPLAICVADVSDLHRYCHAEHLPEQLLQQLLPGPVTLILQRRQEAPLCAELNPGLETIGVRIPDADFIRGVCRDHGGAIALTSANISGAASPLCVNDFAHLWPLCAAVFNGMRIQADRTGSTIVDLSVVDAFKIVRPGVSLAEVQSLLQSNGLRQIE